VVRVVEKSALVSTSEYLGHRRPSLDDPLIRKTVVQNRGRFNNEPARMWLVGIAPESFELLGRIPPTDAENEMECNVYGGKWSTSTGREAFNEWRWLHDRAAYEEEIRQRQHKNEHRARLPQKPKEMMSEEVFWSIIDLLDWSHEGNDELVLEPAIEALALKSKTEIRAFEERLAFLLYQLDTKAHASNIGEASYDPASDYISADEFLYARCVAVANGRAFYEAALNDPRAMPKDMEFESLLEVASAAYELKTGDDFEHATGCSYESFSNPVGWGRESNS
jgi:hypothetical protein